VRFPLVVARAPERIPRLPESVFILVVFPATVPERLVSELMTVESDHEIVDTSDITPARTPEREFTVFVRVARDPESEAIFAVFVTV
jgi:hypothetical protein